MISDAPELTQEVTDRIIANAQSGTLPTQIDFFIVGFPRSRLAWIANYLSWGGQAVIFDALANGIYHDGVECLSELPQSAYLGVADSGLVMFQDILIEKYPKAKWVIVERPYSEVKQSCLDLNIPAEKVHQLATLHHKIGELKFKVNPLVVPFDTLNESIKDIAKFVNPSWGTPQWRHDQLIGFNVQSKFTVDDFLKIPEVNELSKQAEPLKPTQTQEDFFKLLQEICGNEKFAYRWLWQAIASATVIDHVHDADPIDIPAFDHAMQGLLLEWGVNPFFRQYATQLIPTLSAAISAWKYSGHRSKHYDIYSELPCVVAFILGGQERVNQFSPKLRAIVEQLQREDAIRDGESNN